MRLGIGLALACALATPAAAQSTANELLSDCETFLANYRVTGPETFVMAREPHAWQCFGYMSAVSEIAYLVNINELDGTEHRPFAEIVCLPPRVQVTQLIRIFVNYSRQHPEQLNEHSSTVVLASLMPVYPCKQ
jgi:hypothetical protein